ISETSVGDRSAQQEVQGENLNDFVACLTAGGRLKQHAEHDTVRRPERQVNKFTRNQDKNRFTNAVLFSQGSIDLASEVKEDGPYINASKLPCPGGALIMSQAPMKETLIDFYRLIWQQKINTIVCLVNLDDHEQCHPYFEKKAGKKITSRKRFRVRTVAVRSEGKNIVHYELKIENYLEKSSQTSRVLNVISIIGWEPDSNFDVKIVVAAIHSADALKRIVPACENGKSAPMLIHGCSGIRRTGVFALAYIFSKQILGNRVINLQGVIATVRNVRYGVLRQKNMFFLLLEVIIALITETGLVKPGSEDHLQVVQVVKKMYKSSAGKKDGKPKSAPKTPSEKKDDSSRKEKKKDKRDNKKEEKDDDKEYGGDEDSDATDTTKTSTKTKTGTEGRDRTDKGKKKNNKKK
ncbi:hypothetical protein PFISCL1PPCAC_22050, partial [Pristionchus fissidentatus]